MIQIHLGDLQLESLVSLHNSRCVFLFSELRSNKLSELEGNQLINRCSRLSEVYIFAGSVYHFYCFHELITKSKSSSLDYYINNPKLSIYCLATPLIY